MTGALTASQQIDHEQRAVQHKVFRKGTFEVGHDYI